MDLRRLAIVKLDALKAVIEMEELQFEYRKFAAKPSSSENRNYSTNSFEKRGSCGDG